MEKTLIFFGAGSTFTLGSPVTLIQEEFIKLLISDEPIKERIIKNNDFNNNELIKDFELTLTLLMDGNGAKNNEKALKQKELTINQFVKNYKKLNIPIERYKLLRYFDINIFPHYDWLAFKSIFKSLIEQSEKQGITLQDILSILTNSWFNNISLPTTEIFEKNKENNFIYLNNPQRIENALNIYKLIIFKLFKHLLRNNLKKIKNILNIYQKFSNDCIDLFLLFPHSSFNSLEEVIGKISFSTLNWDPILPFFYIKACKEINDKIIREKKRIYLSYGAPFIVKKLKGNEEWGFIFDENSATLVNLLSYERKISKLLIKIFKFFIPHGLMNLRLCPRCKNMFIILPDDVGKLNYEKFLDIFLLDPLPTFNDLKLIQKRNFTHYNLNDFPSKINCPICKVPTYFKDNFMQIQSIYKPDEPPFIQKLYADYNITFSQASHIVFIGYSFPVDDIPHLLSLLTMSIGDNKIRKFTIILHDKDLNDKKWYLTSEAIKKFDKLKKFNKINTIKNMQKFTQKKNIRLNFYGFPDILLKLDIKEILFWNN